MSATVVFDRHGRVTHGPPRASLPPPPISLFYRPRKPVRSSEGIKLKLHSEPNNPNNNSEYSFFMRFLQPHDTDPEDFCDFVIDLQKVIHGQNLQGGPARYRLAKDLLKGRHFNPTLERAFEGPYKITKVNDNGTVVIRKTVRSGAKHETLNIRRMRPYHRTEQDAEQD